MRKALQIAAVLTVLASTPAHAESDLLRQASQACVFGAAVLGATSVIVLYPAMVVGTSTVPTGALIIGNTLFGCGISALGAVVANGYGRVYDRLFPPPPQMPAPTPDSGASASPDAPSPGKEAPKAEPKA
jgi:hypothetical protein